MIGYIHFYKINSLRKLALKFYQNKNNLRANRG